MARLRRTGSYYTATREFESRGYGHTVMVIAVLRPYDVINVGWQLCPNLGVVIDAAGNRVKRCPCCGRRLCGDSDGISTYDVQYIHSVFKFTVTLYVSITGVENDNTLAQGILVSSSTSAVAMIHSVYSPFRMTTFKRPIRR